jgi:hypothetical protein
VFFGFNTENGEYMEALSFEELLETISQQISSKEKQSFVETAANQNSFSCDQIVQLLDKYGINKDKLHLLEVLRPKISDMGNTFQIMDALPFTKDKKIASNILGQPTYVEMALRNELANPEQELPTEIEELSFSKLLGSLCEHNLPKAKFPIIEMAAYRNSFNCVQIVKLINTFNFSRHKLRALQILSYRIIDRENDFFILSAFQRSLDKKRASELLK